MSYETTKAVLRRIHDTRFFSRYFVGNGIDIGCGQDSINAFTEVFTQIGSVKGWDKQDGDAQFMSTVPDNTYDFVLSSHCLEHMQDPFEAIKNWLRILKPHGHMVLVVPDEDLYERGVFPSQNNPDHKWTFTIWKQKSWTSKSINIFDLLKSLDTRIQILKIELLDATFRPSLKNRDQTLFPNIGECAIEVILKKL